MDLLGNDILIVEGEERSNKFLSFLSRKKAQEPNLDGMPLLIDILYCEGCIDGKYLGVQTDIFEKRRIVADYVQQRFKKVQQSGVHYKDYMLLIKNTVQAPEFLEWLKIVEKLIAENSLFRA